LGDELFSAVHGVPRSEEVEVLALNPDVRLVEWVVPRQECRVDLVPDFGGGRVGDTALVRVAVAEIVECCLLKLHDVAVVFFVAFVELILRILVNFYVISLFLDL